MITVPGSGTRTAIDAVGGLPPGIQGGGINKPVSNAGGATIKFIEGLKKQEDSPNAALEEKVKAIQDQWSAESIKLESREIAPRKSDIAVDQVTLCWLPYTSSGGQLTPAWES